MQKPFTKNYHICIFMSNFRSCFWELSESVVTNSTAQRFVLSCWTTDWVSLGHCVKSEVIVLDRGIFLRERSSRRKIPRSKTITDEFTQWPKQRWCKVIIVINNRYFDNFVCFMCIFWQKHEENSIFIISVLIPVNEFQSVQTWWSLRDVISARIRGALRAIVCAFTLTRECARDNTNVTRRSHYQKSLLRDNDRAVFRARLVIIYVDLIALLRRLLIEYRDSFMVSFKDERALIWQSMVLLLF